MIPYRSATLKSLDRDVVACVAEAVARRSKRPFVKVTPSVRVSPQGAPLNVKVSVWVPTPVTRERVASHDPPPSPVGNQLSRAREIGGDQLERSVGIEVGCKIGVAPNRGWLDTKAVAIAMTIRSTIRRQAFRSATCAPDAGTDWNRTDRIDRNNQYAAARSSSRPKRQIVRMLKNGTATSQKIRRVLCLLF